MQTEVKAVTFSNQVIYALKYYYIDAFFLHLSKM